MKVTISYNNQDYLAEYNEQTGYYEIELDTPQKGGVYDIDVRTTDILGDYKEINKKVQIFAKEKIKLETNKVFMWIFDYRDFAVKDITELSDYEFNIDEETNANSMINVLKKTSAKAKDIVFVKKNNEIVYWGTIDNIQNENGQNLYEYIVKYITNIFNQKIKLENENLISEKGVEDFIAKAIIDNFISNADTFVNKTYLKINVKTHTKKQVSVSNVENGIYNLHTWMTNCTQNYDIVYSFDIVDGFLEMTIENKAYEKELIDIQAQPISNYTEVFETKVVSKVVVLYDKVNDTDQKGEYALYLLNDRTTTTDMTNVNRAEGETETVYTEKYEDAAQTALDKMKANSYNHNITFKYYNKLIKVGTPIAIKTKQSVILNTYISAIKITQSKSYEYICGNIRINFIDKLLKERKG